MKQAQIEWTTNETGLPVLDLTLPDDVNPTSPYNHLLGSGHLSAMVNRWGNVNLFTTEGGFLWINSPHNSFTRSAVYPMLEVNGELISLLHSELSAKEKIRIGTGYVEYHGRVKNEQVDLRVTREIFVSPNRECALFARISLTNLNNEKLDATLHIYSDVTLPPIGHTGYHQTAQHKLESAPGLAVFPDIHPILGNVFLKAGPDWNASSRRSTLRLSKRITINSNETFSTDCTTGYSHEGNYNVPDCTPEKARQKWAARLEPFAEAAPEEWMRRECLWNAGQVLSFTNYDSSVNEYYTAIGGYGWWCFSVREVSQTSMVLASRDWDLSASSLRFVAKTQLANGDVPKAHAMSKEKPPPEFDSDNELWFVLGCCESVATSGNTAFLDEVCSFWDEGEGTIWEHIKRAFYWVRDSIGTGAHGLVLIREGDWNDYLSLVGAEGRGESTMNSGMACRAFTSVAWIARQRGEKDFAAAVETYVEKMRQAVDASFDRGWFTRGYTDTGEAYGSFDEDRLFINAQSWAVLGKCGTAEQRKLALRNAIEKCHTDIGLMLMSRPYSSPAPDSISWCAIPAGEGENAGIWPQTVHWMVWALAEEGLLDEALSEWKCGTLHSHHQHFPDVPYGIFNGPDCFSSKWAGAREGYTQAQLLDRAQFVPMNPMIAWQGFSLEKINAARHRAGETAWPRS